MGRASTVASVVEGAGGVFSDDQKRFIAPDGTARCVEQNAAPIKDDQGTILGMVLVIRDITERRRADEALRDADRRKEEFLAVLSHELRNPLASIQTALELMRHAESSGAGVDGELSVVERQVQHLTSLVDDLLDVSLINRGRIELHKEIVDLAAAVALAVEVVRPMISERRQDLEITLPDESIRLEADPTRLGQVLLNLLTNASKYTGIGGRISLAAEFDRDEVVVRIRDTGIGIAPALLPVIFDLFVQGQPRSDPAHGGMGIGLSLVKSLVEKHDGSLVARSGGAGMGSEFVFRLPALPARQPADPSAAERAPADAPESWSRHRILIVDDNAVAADGLGRLLGLVYRQDVRVVYDGRAALDLAGSFQPDVVLLDLGMTIMDGYEVARRLRERPEFARVRIVALTGWGQEEDRRRTLEMGFDLHLTKPVSANTLKRILTDLEPDVRGHGLLTLGAQTNP